jgi:hypothetical protein
VEKRKLSYTFGGNINKYRHYGKQYEVSSKKLKLDLPYDPAIPRQFVEESCGLPHLL